MNRRMERGNTIVISVLSLIFILFSSGVWAADGKEPCPKRLKIGVSLPLTSAASSGQAVMNSIVLADEEYDKSNCVEFLFEDDQLLAKNTVSIVNKFIDVNHVDGLIVYGTPTSIAVGNIVEKNKIPLIALSILGKVVQDKNYIVKHWCTAERLNESVARESKRKGYKKVAIVSTQNDAMLGLRDLYKQEKIADVILDDEYIRENNDFRSSIAKIISKKADAVYVLLFPPQTGIFVKQLRAQGFTGDAFGVHNIEDPQEVEISGGAMNGMWFANGDETAGDNYRARYLRRFGMETSLGGGNGFDSAKMFIEAANKQADVNSFLHQLKGFQGAFGTYNATAKNDFDFPAVIKTVEKNGFRKLTVTN